MRSLDRPVCWVSLDDALQLRLDRHALEHADVAAAGVASRHDAHRGAQRTQHDSHRLPECRNRPTTAKFDLEHQPMGDDMRDDVGLADDMRALEMPEARFDVVLCKEVPRLVKFGGEGGLLHGVHDALT